MLKWNFPYRGWEKTSLLWSLCLILLGSGWASAQSFSDGHNFKFISPETITAKHAKELLDTIGLGTVSPMPGTNGLLITADSNQLAKVMAVLSVADRRDVYAVQCLGTDQVLSQWTSPSKLAMALGQVTIADFDSQTRNNIKGDILLDTYQGKTWLVAPQSQLEHMAGIINAGPQALTAPPKETSTVNPAVAETGRLSDDKLFKPVITAATPLATSPAALLADDSNAVDIQNTTTPSVDASPKAESMSTTVPLSTPKVVPSHQSEYIMPPLPNGEEPLNLQLEEKLPITELLALVGQYYKLDYMYDPAEVQGDITLRLQGELKGPLKVKHLYPLLEYALKSKNLVMTRKDNLVLIVPESKVMDVDPELMTQGGLVEYGDVVLTRIFNLRYISTETAENLLDQMKLQIQVTPIPETKTLIVTAYAFRLPRIERLLELVDKEGDPKEFRYRQLKYTLAKNMADKVKGLSEQLSSVDISVSEGEDQPEAITQNPGESDAAFRARRARLLAQQRARQAALARSRTTTSNQTETTDAVYLDADERTNRILMIGHKDELDIVENLINSLDVAQQDLRTLKLYKIDHLDAEEVRNKLADLGVIQGKGSDSSNRITGEPRSVSGNPATPARTTPNPSRALETTTELTDGAEILQDEPQVVIVEATNSLLINATPEQHQRISDIIHYIDNQTDLKNIDYVVYPLENQNPTDMADTLEKLLQDTIVDPEGKTAPTTIKKTEENIVIVPDENTFSLIVYANQRNQQWIKNLIQTLDKRRPQVLIQVSLVEISKNDEFNYDLNLIESFPDLTKTSGLTSGLLGDSTQNLVSALTDSTNNSNHLMDLQSNSGNGIAFYGDKHINALLKLVQQKSYGRVMAKPKVLVNDNETGTIDTTDKTYVKKEGAVAGDQGAVSSTVDYEAYPTGVSLEITPHISEGDLLRLEIKMNRSDIKTSYSDGRPPDTTESNVQTVVTVPDKSTIILGGLTKLNQGKSASKVPLLGDLPLIGGLFRGISNEDKQNHVYVFVKAEIIRPADVLAGTSDLVDISERQRIAFERHEGAFQNYESWPGLKEKVITPERVLDAQ